MKARLSKTDRNARKGNADKITFGLREFHNMSAEAFVDIPTAAAILNIGVSTAWARGKRGELKIHHFGKSARIQVGNLRAIIAGAQS